MALRILLFVSLVFASSLVPETAEAQDAAAEDASSEVEIVLNDGSVLRGRILEEDSTRIVIQTSSAGRIEIARQDVQSISPLDEASERRRGGDPDFNTVFFTPTPETLGAGGSYFRNFLLFFLNGGFGVTEYVDVSVGTMFPVSSDLLFLSVGAKVRLLSRETSPVGLAVVGQGTFVEDESFGSFGAVAGIGNRDQSLNLALLRSASEAEDGAIFLIGADKRVFARTKVLVEFGNSTEAIGDDDEDDFNGLINVGFRWFGERMSFSLTGIRPFAETDSSFLFLPMTMFSMHF